MKGASALIAAIAALLAPLANAHAQPADPPACGPYRAKWASVAGGSDVAAMDGIIKVIPGLCPALSAEAKARRASVVRDIAARDPCIRARNDWPYVQNASEQTIFTYRDGLPAACGVWRSQAQDKLNMFEAQRVAERKDAERKRQDAESKQAETLRIAQVVGALKATGIEGRWMLAPKSTYAKCMYRYSVLADGSLQQESLEPLKEEWRYKKIQFQRVSGNIIYNAYGPITVAGNQMTWEFTSDKYTYTYVRC